MMKNFFINNEINKKNIHLLFLSILSLNYIIPLLIFSEITLFYLDSLDHEIVYNSVIGKIFAGDLDAVKIFLNGEIKLEYLRRLFQPHLFLYSIFNTELAYWIVDILVKLTSYFSFFILAKKINKNFYLCGLVSCLFASATIPTHEGFGLAILPYVVYLIFYKDNLKFKNYFILIFFGLNTDILATGISLITLSIFLLLYLKKEKYVQVLKVLSVFSACILIANWNLLFITFRGDELHRIEFLRESYSFYDSLINFFITLFWIPRLELTYSLFYSIPFNLFIIPLMASFYLFKDKMVILPIFTVILIMIILALLQYDLIGNYINNSDGLIKKVSWNYLNRVFILLYSLSIISILIKKNIFTKVLVFFVYVSIFLFQINSSIVPFVKKNILKEKNYQNLYTFKGYYYFYDYTLIKKIVKNDRTISIGLDPMVAVFHNIKVVDGYHNIYPLSYKKKFRKIIEKELIANSDFKNYYDGWGSRVYSLPYHAKDPKDIKLDFEEAKKIGVKFVISKYSLNSKNLRLVVGDCKKNNFCLYRIE